MTEDHEKIIKEGGYQPAHDPPPQPPATVVKPAASQATPAPSSDADTGSDD